MIVSIDGRALYCEVHGAGPPVLLVHGFPASGRMWDAVVAKLPHDYRVIVPDLRGHGRSEPAPTASLADYADDLARLLDALDEPRPVALVGMSMGGYIAFEFCRRHAERVRALVLTNTRAQADTPEAAQGRRESAARVRREGSVVVAEAMMSKLFGPAASQAVRDECWEMMTATPPEGAAAALLAMAERRPSFDTLAALDRPILIVAGEHDAITPPSDAEQMRAAAPRARLVVVPGTGHMTVMEQPERFAEALGGFLGEVFGG